MNVIKDASEKCNGLQKCSYYAEIGKIKDPCPGTEKYTRVKFICVMVSFADKFSRKVQSDLFIGK